MAIDQNALKQALGKDYDPTGDYLVCGYNDLGLMLSKGYKQVGTIQDPSPQDNDLLVFERPKKCEPPPPMPAQAPAPPKKRGLFS